VSIPLWKFDNLGNFGDWGELLGFGAGSATLSRPTAFRAAAMAAGATSPFSAKTITVHGSEVAWQ